jgi:murein DD-endopeptidase MepM/ murein hydrolase activator NlpD
MRPWKILRIVRLMLISLLLPSPLFVPAAMARDAQCGDGLVKGETIDRFTKCAIGRFRKCDASQAVARGLFETGLRPVFPAGLNCRHIDEGYAIDYASKRNRQVYHGGIDMPAPWGTPIIAAAAGTVVGKFKGERSFRGIEIVLRHCPEDTGIPLWIYTQYSHFSRMPKLEIGQRVRMGEILGPTGNTGIGRHGRQSRKRRPAIHFGVFYSTSDQYAIIRDRVMPVDGRWMDPVALYRKKLPLDSEAMKSLPKNEKQIPISVMLDTGEVIPADSRIVWPYQCTRR